MFHVHESRMIDHDALARRCEAVATAARELAWQCERNAEKPWQAVSTDALELALVDAETELLVLLGLRAVSERA